MTIEERKRLHEIKLNRAKNKYMNIHRCSEEEAKSFAIMLEKLHDLDLK